MPTLAMRSSLLALSVVGAGVLAACDFTSVDPQCRSITNTQQTTRGDSVVTTTGLIYRELAVGTGAQVASTSECQAVSVRYTGRLLDGTVFDQSPAGQSFSFLLGGQPLIPGFEQGIVGMRVGGTRQLIIPPALAYGSTDVRNNQGQVVIPGNSTLVFDVELVAVEQD